MKKKVKQNIGWREYLAIPELKIKKMKVKIDTGARTSALHVTDLVIHTKGKKKFAEFYVHPNQDSSKPRFKNMVPVSCFKNVKSSNGISSLRPVIVVNATLGKMVKEIEVTLVNRDLMGFRMLLGRAALRKDFYIDAGRSYLLNKDK